MVNNKPFEAWLQLVKTDKQGHNVKLSHATFKIKDSAGNYLKQKVGLFYKDEWTTDDDGKVVLEDMVKAGSYTLEEIKSPDGFLLSDNIQFKIDSEDKTITFDDEGDPVLKITVQNEKPTGTIVLEKAFEQSDNSFAPKKENLQAKFQLTANSEIVDPADGTVIYRKGDVVKTGNSQDGIYTTSKDGKLEITDLPLGTGEASYILKEVETEKGYVLNHAAVTYDFSIKDNTTKVYREVKQIENKLTTAYFKKTDVAGKEVEGAKLVLSDKDGNIIDEWTSSKEEHIMKGLIIGETYTLHEEVSAEGYVKASDITFTFKEDQQKTIMIDKIVSVSKTDVTGEKELEGAHIQVTDEDGKIVDEWISTKESHHINNLVEGKIYTLTETTAPDGYIKAESITFEVSTDKEDQFIVMKDKQVSFKKIDQNGHVVVGAKLQIVEKDSQKVIETFVTDGNIYYSKNVEIGKTYILQEIETPENYIKADDIEFSVSKENENQVISMTDIKLDEVVISKQDATTKKELEGAHLKITDEDGNIAESITFTVDDNGEVVQKIVMLDQHIPTILKTSDSVNILSYAGISLCAIAGLILLRKRGKNDEQ